jgi:S-adenosylmethionine:diacylglycerol 3-amino-3-carboxypropyl transferase
MKQKEKLAVQDQQIESKEAELEEIIIRIEDTEAFAEEVADAAYEQAVEVVTRTVQEEIRNEDFDLIEEQRRIVLNNAELSDKEYNLADRIFRGLMNRFKGMTHYITNKLAVILRSPERKAEIKEPIKESIRDRLARSQKQADELNARRRAGRSMSPKRRRQDMELF